MEVTYRRDANHSYLVIRSDEKIDNTYAIKMLSNNKIPGMLEMKIRNFDNLQEFYYDISSKVLMKDYYDRNKMTEHEIKEFIFGISKAAESVKEYLLDINCICLMQEMIFINPQNKTPQFCYFPKEQGEFFSSLKTVVQKMLTFVDYENRQAVAIAYGLQQIIINENYTVEELLKFVTSEAHEEYRYGIDSMSGMKNTDANFLSQDDTYKEKSGNETYVKNRPNNKKFKKRKLSDFLKTGFVKKEELKTLEDLRIKD